MLLVMLQEEHLSNKKPLLLIPKSSIPEQVQEAKHGEPPEPVSFSATSPQSGADFCSVAFTRLCCKTMDMALLPI